MHTVNRVQAQGTLKTQSTRGGDGNNSTPRKGFSQLPRFMVEGNSNHMADSREQPSTDYERVRQASLQNRKKDMIRNNLAQ